MKDEALKIIAVIQNSSNRIEHLEAIDRMIENFTTNWFSTHSGIEFDSWFDRMIEEKSNFLTRIEKIDTKDSNPQIRNMENFTKLVTPHICLQMSFGDEPFVIRFISSGWSSPRLFHVIREFGDMEQSDYVGTMSAEQIKERYGFDIDLENSSLKRIALDIPNDQTLGREIRNIVNSLTQTI